MTLEWSFWSKFLFGNFGMWFSVLTWLEHLYFAGSEPLHNQWRFAGTSYIEYWAQFRRAIQKFDLTVTFKLTSSSGMLLFASQYKDGSGSFILIQIVNHIFQLGIGTGEAHSIIRYVYKKDWNGMILYGCTVHHCSLPYTLELGEWNTVSATFVHSPGYAYLVHDGIIPSVGSVQVRQAYDAHFTPLATFCPSKIWQSNKVFKDHHLILVCNHSLNVNNSY